MIFFVIVLSVASLFWLAVMVQSWNMKKHLKYLSEESEPVSTPKVSVIVPARDESRILSQSLQSLLDLDYPDLEIILVDDHSTDSTRDIALKFSKQDSRLQVLSGAELPPDWQGKCWALQQGAAVAKGNWLLFTDADMIHERHSLRSALATAQREKVDLLSILPQVECVSFWEKVIMPAFAGILMLIRPLHKSNDSASPVAIAAGGFLLIKTVIFKFVGGFSAIRGFVAEDLRLAELMKFKGYKIQTLLAETPAISTRMYYSFQELWQGLSRHAFEGAGYNPYRLIGSMLLGYLLIVLPAITFLAGIIQGNWILIAGSVLPVLAMIFLQMNANRYFRVPSYYFFSFPLATAIYGLIMLSSVISFYFRGGNVWKGRRYRNVSTQKPKGAPEAQNAG